MKTFTKFAAATLATAALAMAGSASATTFINIGSTSNTGNNQIAWVADDVGGGTLSISGLATKINFDDSVYSDGDGLDAILTFTGTAAAGAGNLVQVGFGNFIQQELAGSFSFKSLNGQVTYLSGTFAHYWLQGTVGSNGSGNVTSSVGTANFASDLVDLSYVKGDNFQFGFTQTNPAFSIVNNTLQNFQGNNVTGSFGGVVPEPGTWALMIIGFGGAGAMLRRRRTVFA